MPFRHETVPGYPIIIHTFEGKFTFDVLVQALEAAVPKIRELSGTLYTIIDVVHADTTFMDMIQILKQNDDVGEEIPSITDFRLFIVGTSEMVKFYVNAARQKQFGGEIVPLFANLADAITAAKTAYDQLNYPSDTTVQSA